VTISNSSATRSPNSQRKLRPLDSIHRVTQFTLAAAVATLHARGRNLHASPEFFLNAQKLPIVIPAISTSSRPISTTLRLNFH
jgi:hypothetical protein